mmetsp:Transcript_61237/g.132710  ORF Transcript_61237/g.132710 Transcript_61237/m.132710 type:complete len:244 (+) Transcript_61237:49-780(+)
MGGRCHGAMALSSWPLVWLAAALAAVAGRVSASKVLLASSERRAEALQFSHDVCLRRMAPLPKAEGFSQLCTSIQDLYLRDQRNQGQLSNLQTENVRLSAAEKDTSKRLDAAEKAKQLAEQRSQSALQRLSSRQNTALLQRQRSKEEGERKALERASRELAETKRQRDELLAEVKRLREGTAQVVRQAEAGGDELRKATGEYLVASNKKVEACHAEEQKVRKALLTQIEALQNENARLAAQPR